LLICELPLTFVGAALVLHAPLGRREWTSAVVMTAGLAALVYFLDPHAGKTVSISPVVWVVGLGVSLGSVAALVTAGWRASGDRRAAFYGAATGIEFGTTAALMKAAVGHLSQPASLFTSWETYAMIAAGVVGVFLMQNAMQSGKIVAAQPGITLLDPFTAIVWGIFGFSEQAQTGGVHLGIATGGGVLIVAAAQGAPNHQVSRGPSVSSTKLRSDDAGPLTGAGTLVAMPRLAWQPWLRPQADLRR